MAAPTPPSLKLPAPATAGLISGVDIGLPPDRLLVSKVPGTIRDDEQVYIDVSGDGTPAKVEVQQRLSIVGTGDYVVRERGPARAAVPIGDGPAPVLQRGTVVWQGFSPGRRDLAATLSLDAGLEAARLPLSVGLSFQPADGGPARPLEIGGKIPGPGRVSIRLTDLAPRQMQLPSGDAPATVAAPLLDRLLDSATHPQTRPPVAGVDLPPTIPALAVGPSQDQLVRLPLHVTGTIRVPGSPATFTGPGLVSNADGATVAGVLSDTVTFEATVIGPGRLELDLTALPGLDARTLKPPSGRTWAEWARTSPPATQRAAAVSTLMSSAAQAAIATDFAPYLSANLKGVVTSGFHLRVSQRASASPAVRALSPRPIPIAIVTIGVLAIALALNRLRRHL